MKTFILPFAVLVIVASTLVSTLKMRAELRAARAENAVLAERLSRAVAVATAMTQYHEATKENAVANIASVSRDDGELRDAVADKPRVAARKPAPLPLPGYTAMTPTLPGYSR